MRQERFDLGSWHGYAPRTDGAAASLRTAMVSELHETGVFQSEVVAPEGAAEPSAGVVVKRLRAVEISWS